MCKYVSAALPVFQVRVFDLAVMMMSIISWHHSIAAGGCSCEDKDATLTTLHQSYCLLVVLCPAF